MMVRTQVSLEAESHRRAKQRADALGLSLAEYVRRLVDADLADPRDGQASLDAVVDLGDGGATDVGEDKDRLVGGALAAKHGDR